MKLELSGRKKTLRQIFAVLSVFGLGLCAGPAQESTNAPKTQIEAFEAQTDTVIVKGIGQASSLTTSVGPISVRCKESVDVATGRKQYGIVVDLAENNQSKDRILIDYDELDSLISGIDYLSKISYDVTPLPSFDAVFSTKSGLRFVAYSSRRQGGIQTFLQYGDNPRIPLASDQVAQIRDLISQARTALAAMMAAK
jgi:hypothetical protein